MSQTTVTHIAFLWDSCLYKCPSSLVVLLFFSEGILWVNKCILWITWSNLLWTGTQKEAAHEVYCFLQRNSTSVIVPRVWSQMSVYLYFREEDYFNLFLTKRKRQHSIIFLGVFRIITVCVLYPWKGLHSFIYIYNYCMLINVLVVLLHLRRSLVSRKIRLTTFLWLRD